MIPWETLAEITLSKSGQVLGLYRRGDEHSMRMGSQEIANSRLHNIDDEMGQLLCEGLREAGKILLVGSGMGFSLRSILKVASATSTILVVEPVKEIVKWNRGILGPLSGNPLADPRVKVTGEELFAVLKARPGFYDRILLDLDTIPAVQGNSRKDPLHSRGGIRSIVAALRTDGVLGIRSISGDDNLRIRLEKLDLLVTEHRIFSRPGKKGRRQPVWMVKKGKPEEQPEGE